MFDNLYVKMRYRSPEISGFGDMAASKKISVLLLEGEAERFEQYCQERGYKKSTLIARLVREHLDKEGFQAQLGFLGMERNRHGKKQ